MEKEMALLIDRIENLRKLNIISWGSPVISFGDLTLAKIATVGLNPSNLEFVDHDGKELSGIKRRFHTLKSLGLRKWQDAEKTHHQLILNDCFNYFRRNPYDVWFKKLDYLISGTDQSFYFPSGRACHLDLIPYATFNKWTALEPETKSALLETTSDILGMLIKKSDVSMLILNGNTVVNNFQKITNVEFNKIHIKEWTLPRKGSSGVLGFAFEGKISSIGKIKLKKDIKVLGYNHNIQSSFGVTKQVQTAIRNWITNSINQ